MRLWIVSVLLLLTGPAHAASVRLAVLDFLNASPDPVHAPLSAGLRSMMVTDLSRAPDTTVVERDRLDAILGELELQRTEAFDPKTAVRVGELAGATHLVDGSFVVVDDTMRLDARLIDIASGTTLLGESIEGERLAFFELEKSLVTKLLAAMSVKLAPKDRAAVGRVHTADWDAFVRFSTGIAAFDAERYQEALDQLDQALVADDTFELAELTQREFNVAIEQLGVREQALRTARVQREALERSEEAAELFAVVRELEALAASSGDASRADRLAALAILAGWYAGGSFGPLGSEIDRFEAQLLASQYLRRYVAEAQGLAPRVAVYPPSNRYLSADSWRERLADVRERVWGDGEQPDVSILDAYRPVAGCSSSSSWGRELFLDLGQRADLCLRSLQEARALGYPPDRADTWRWGLVFRLGDAGRFGDAARLWLEIGQSADEAELAARSRRELETLRRYTAAIDGASDRERAREAILLGAAVASGRSIDGVPLALWVVEHDGEPYATWARTAMRRLHEVSSHRYVLVNDTPVWPVVGWHNLESGARTDALRTDELVYLNPEDRGTLRPTEPSSWDSLAFVGRAPRSDVTLSFTAHRRPRDDWWPKHRRPARDEVGEREFDQPAAPPSILVGGRDWEVPRRRVPGGGSELHRPFRAWTIEIADDEVRLFAVQLREGGRDEARFDRTPLAATRRRDRGDGAVRVELRVEVDGTVTLRLDRKAHTLRIPDYEPGLVGLHFRGHGFSRIAELAD